MPRVQGLNKDEVGDEIRRVLERQEQRYGAVLYNHMVLARRPGIFRGFRAMWREPVSGLSNGLAGLMMKPCRASTEPSRSAWV